APETLGKEAPQSFATDFIAAARESADGALRMLCGGRRYFDLNAQPVANSSHLAKRYPSLHHSKTARDEPQKKDSFRYVSIKSEIRSVGRPRVFERVVDMSYWRTKAQVRDSFSQTAHRLEH